MAGPMLVACGVSFLTGMNSRFPWMCNVVSVGAKWIHTGNSVSCSFMFTCSTELRSLCAGVLLDVPGGVLVAAGVIEFLPWFPATPGPVRALLD